MRFQLLSVACSLWAASCSPGVGTQAIVRIDASESLRAEAETLQIRIWGDDGSLRLDRVASLREPGAEATLPSEVPVSPEHDDPERSFRFEATLLSGDGDLLAQQGFFATGFLPSERWTVELFLDDSCRGVTCSELDTCIEGVCSFARLDPGAQLEAGSDDIDRVCEGDACWQHPLPGGGRFEDGCLYDERSAFVTGPTGSVRHWADGVWSSEDPGVPADTGAIASVSCWEGAEAVAITQGRVTTRVAGEWVTERLPITARIVWGANPDDVWVGGTGGALARRRGGPAAAFEPVDSPFAADETVSDIDGTAPDNVLFTGDRVFHFDGSTFTQLGDPPFAPSTGTIAPDGTFLISGPFRPSVVEWNGEAWVRSDRFPNNCVSLASSDTSLVCGAGAGQVRRWSLGGGLESLDPESRVGRYIIGTFVGGVSAWEGAGLAVTREHDIVYWPEGGDPEYLLRRETRSDLADLDGSGDLLVAVGPGGALLERGGRGRWTLRDPFPPGTDDPPALLAVDATSDPPVVVGSGGTILERDETGVWRAVSSPTETRLRAVHGHVAVGAGGVVVVRVDGTWRLHAASDPALGELSAVDRSVGGRVVFGSESGDLFELLADDAVAIAAPALAGLPVRRIRSNATGTHVLAAATTGATLCRLDRSDCLETVPIDTRATDFLLDASGVSHVAQGLLRGRAGSVFEDLAAPATYLARDGLGKVVMTADFGSILGLRD